MSEPIRRVTPNGDEEPPSLVGSWALLNGVVIGWLFVVIVLCWAFSGAFR